MGAYDCDCINNLEYDRRERKERERLTKSQSTAGQLNDGAQSTNLIDRQQAIDAIAQCTNCGDEDTLREYVLKHNLDNGWTGGILEALDAVKDLPTAQSEKAQHSRGSTTSDLISRTETVEHLRRMLEATVSNTDYDEGFIDGVQFAISTVSTMPPAQPEPTDEQVAEYCKRRCLHVVTDDFFRVAQPEPHWIPCSERMPEEHEWLGTKKFGTTISDEVYVTFENEKGERFCQHMKFQNGELSRYDQFHMDTWFKGSKPIAWMPLPMPFEGGIE